MASFLWNFLSPQPSSTDLHRKHPSSMVVELLSFNVRNLPGPASSVQISVGHREDSGVQSSTLGPDTSMSWPGSSFSQQKLVIRPSSTLFLKFYKGRTCVYDIEVPFSAIISGFPGNLESSVCAYTAKDAANNSVELQMEINIHDPPGVTPHEKLTNLVNHNALDVSQLGKLLQNYLAVEKLYTQSQRVHPLVRAFVGPTLSSILSLMVQRSSAPPPQQVYENHVRGEAQRRTPERPLSEIVFGMEDLTISLLRNSYNIPQEHHSLLDQIFAEFCRCTALLEEVDGAYENCTQGTGAEASKEREYRGRQEQLFVLLCKVTRLLYKKRAPDEPIDKVAIIEEVLGYVRKEDILFPKLDTPSSQFERYNRPFTSALASPRGYEREAVWNVITTLLKQTQDVSRRNTCLRALTRLVQVSGQHIPAPLAIEDIYVGGLCLPGHAAYVWEGRTNTGTDLRLAFKESQILEKHLKDPDVRQKMFLEIIAWKYIDHPRLLPFLGVQRVSLNREYVTCMIWPWMNKKVLTHEAVKKKLRDDTIRQRCMKEIVEAMIYLHNVGIVHGNLKAANVFMDDGHFLLADYGTWCFADKTLGKAQWTAPELWDSLASYPDAPLIPTVKSDVYSFACFCIELYTGNDPWGAVKLKESEVEAAVRLRCRQPPRPDEMSDGIWEIMQKCLVRSPTQRPDFVTIGQCLAKLAA